MVFHSQSWRNILQFKQHWETAGCNFTVLSQVSVGSLFNIGFNVVKMIYRILLLYCFLCRLLINQCISLSASERRLFCIFCKWCIPTAGSITTSMECLKTACLLIRLSSRVFEWFYKTNLWLFIQRNDFSHWFQPSVQGQPVRILSTSAAPRCGFI